MNKRSDQVIEMLDYKFYYNDDKIDYLKKEIIDFTNSGFFNIVAAYADAAIIIKNRN